VYLIIPSRKDETLMAFNFELPDLGEGITEGEVRKWLVKKGDIIEEHQSVLEIETDKAVVEVPSPRGGTVLSLAKEEGEIAQVGEVLMVIGEAGEKEAAPTATGKQAERKEPPAPEKKKPAPERPKSVSVVGELPEEEEEEGAPTVTEKQAERKEPTAPEKKKPAPERPKSVSVVGELPEEEEEVQPAKAAQPKPAQPTIPEPTAAGTGILAVPAVRKLAKERSVSLESIKGTGPDGSITRDDVLKAAGPAQAGAQKAAERYGEVERVAIRGLRRTIGKNLLFSQKTTAFVTETDEADVTDLWELRNREKQALEGQGVHLTFMPFVIKAVLHTLREFSTFNASVDEERNELVVKKYFHIGVAVDTPEGLIVPVVKDVDRKSVRELAKELQELSALARDRKIGLEDLKGSSFTITNYGAFGATFATSIINYPDVAILGTGRIADKPWVRNGKIEIRKILPLSLTFDHRVNDGAGAAKLLTKLIGYLEDPASLFIESI
jgi:pyruvate dehydrogenase E2 component (dihydrolipoamide acetyltransferase)